MTWGSSGVVRMPGGAFTTTGTAFTARCAVKPGECSAMRSTGTSNPRRTSIDRAGPHGAGGDVGVAGGDGELLA